jgi:hypothetical protein
LPDPPKADLDQLPEVRQISFRLTRYPEPRRICVGTELVDLTTAGEIVVDFADDPPVRALAPAVWVGDVRLTEFYRVQVGRFVFIAPEPDRLEKGAPVRIGWAGSGDGTPVPTEFRFEGFGEEEAPPNP